MRTSRTDRCETHYAGTKFTYGDKEVHSFNRRRNTFFLLKHHYNPWPPSFPYVYIILISIILVTWYFNLDILPHSPIVLKCCCLEIERLPLRQPYCHWIQWWLSIQGLGRMCMCECALPNNTVIDKHFFQCIALTSTIIFKRCIFTSHTSNVLRQWRGDTHDLLQPLMKKMRARAVKWLTRGNWSQPEWRGTNLWGRGLYIVLDCCIW